MRWTWAPAALIVVSCELPGGASHTPADVITPTQASQVVASYWTQNEAANIAGDPALFDSIEAGPALTIDQVQAARSAKLNRHLAEARPLRKVTVYVAHQSRYPAEFAARIDTVGADRDGKLTTQPFTFFNLFEKPSVGQPWKSTFFVVPPPVASIMIALANDGYAEMVPIDGVGLAIAPARMGQVVADYVNGATAGLGMDDSQLDGATEIDALARSQRLSIEGARRAGFTLTAQAAAGPGGSHAYRSAQGRAVVFFAVSHKLIATAARDGACIVQDTRMHLPPEVPLGTYGRVENKVLAMMVASDPPATKGKATVLAITSAAYDFTVESTAGPCIEAGPPTSV